jgi:hypothetical protein
MMWGISTIVDIPPLNCCNLTSFLELVLVLVLSPVLPASLEQLFPEQAQEEVPVLLPLSQAEAMMDRNQPVQSLQKT